MVDWSEALHAFQGNGQILKVVVESAVVEIPMMLDAIRKAVANGDAKSLRLSAHTLKGALRYFGDIVAYKESCRLEKMGQDNSLIDAGVARRDSGAGVTSFVDRAERVFGSGGII